MYLIYYKGEENMFCKRCGKQIPDGSTTCPQCGTYLASTISAYRGESNTIALIGFIFSFFIPLVGLICSIIGYKKSNYTYDRRELAIAGIVISVLSIVLTIILLIVYWKLLFALLSI